MKSKLLSWVSGPVNLRNWLGNMVPSSWNSRSVKSDPGSLLIILDQKVTNYSLEAKYSLLEAALVNTVFLECGHVYSLTPRLWLLSRYNSTGECLAGRLPGPQSLKCLLSSPSLKKLAEPCFKDFFLSFHSARNSVFILEQSSFPHFSEDRRTCPPGPTTWETCRRGNGTQSLAIN